MSTPSFQPPYGAGQLGQPGSAPPGPLAPPGPMAPPAYAVPVARPEPPQRPALLGMSTMMTVTAAMLFMAALGFLWMVAWAGNESIDYNSEGGLYYIMERFHLRLAQGLWVPLFGFPTASIAAAFCLLARVGWARIAYSALALATVAWLLITWHDRPGYLIAPIVYIAFCAAIVWVPTVSRWLAWTDPSPTATSGPPVSW